MISPHRNRWIRIQSVTLVMLVMSQVDRANIALAFPAMRAELGLSATAIGFATGVFFWGYLTLQIPMGRLAAVWSAKRTHWEIGVTSLPCFDDFVILVQGFTPVANRVSNEGAKLMLSIPPWAASVYQL